MTISEILARDMDRAADLLREARHLIADNLPLERRDWCERIDDMSNELRSIADAERKGAAQ